MSKQLWEQLEQATARIEQVIHIGGMLGDGDSLPDPLDELLSEPDDSLVHAFPDMPQWVKDALDDRHERASAFSEWVYRSGRYGFVVEFATPVFRSLDQDGCGSFSWGQYYTRWVYAETLDEAVQQGLWWVLERRADELEKQARAAIAKATGGKA